MVLVGAYFITLWEYYPYKFSGERKRREENNHMKHLEDLEELSDSITVDTIKHYISSSLNLFELQDIQAYAHRAYVSLSDKNNIQMFKEFDEQRITKNTICLIKKLHRYNEDATYSLEDYIYDNDNDYIFDAKCSLTKSIGYIDSLMHNNVPLDSFIVVNNQRITLQMLCEKTIRLLKKL